MTTPTSTWYSVLAHTNCAIQQLKMGQAQEARAIRGDVAMALVRDLSERQEAARRSRFDGAKTSLEKLMVLGVVVTEDDARDNYYISKHRAETAAAAGVASDLIDAAEDYCASYDAQVATLRRWAEQGETDAEHAERVHAALGTKAVEGKKRPCTHRETRRERGVMRVGYNPRTDTESFVCCRCGARAEPPRRTPWPTKGALDAANVLAVLGAQK
jgi:hypothetical protein